MQENEFRRVFREVVGRVPGLREARNATTVIDRESGRVLRTYRLASGTIVRVIYDNATQTAKKDDDPGL